MDKLSVMHAFRRIVERGSFARAAEDLGVSPALLSREIKLLEESLGTTLLTRTTRSMSLTDAGRLYYDEATGILDAVVGVETRIRDGAGAVRGHLKVNASSSFGQTVIAPILPSFLDAYPDLHLTVSMDDRVVDMVEGGFDVSIRIRTAMPDSALVARKVGTMRQRIFAAPAYLERTGVPVVPQEIARHRVIGFLLAAVGIKLRFPSNSDTITWMIPIMVLAVPLFDTTLVFVSRLRRGKNPLTTPGKDHLSHRLAQLTGSKREAVLICYLIGGAAGLVGVFLTQATLTEAVALGTVATATALYALWWFEFRRGGVRPLA